MDIAIGCRVPVVSLGRQLGIVRARGAVTEGRMFELEEESDNTADTLEVALAGIRAEARHSHHCSGESVTATITNMSVRTWMTSS